jgi:HPt (histidine-containing phosphotransfer) domain-containing protein
MPEKMDQNLQEKLRAIEELFTERLPERLRELDAALSRCLNEPRQKEHCVTLHRVLHTLAGSAGTFGFVELGLRARKLEEAVNQLIRDGTAVDHGLAEIGDELTDFLRWAARNPKGGSATLC